MSITSLLGRTLASRLDPPRYRGLVWSGLSAIVVNSRVDNAGAGASNCLVDSLDDGHCCGTCIAEQLLFELGIVDQYSELDGGDADDRPCGVVAAEETMLLTAGQAVITA